MVKIFYVADFDFAKKNASSMRIINNCKALSNKSHFQIKLIGCSEKSDYFEDKFPVSSVKPGIFIMRYLKILFKGFLFVNKLKKQNKNHQIDCIIYYGTSSLILIPLHFFCKKNSIKLIIDVVEWYNYAHLPYGKYGPFALDVHLAITKLIPKCNGAVVISTYLEHYFERKKLRTLRVPPLVDFTDQGSIGKQPGSLLDRKCLNLIYAGFPGKKDMISVMVDAVRLLNTEGFLIKLHILGPTKAELCKLLSSQPPDNIVCHGKIDQKLIAQYLHQADFSLFIRPNERYSQAGFPTKFVESMSAGLPVITNLTSDLNLYLKDGYNGFVLKDCSPQAIVDKIKEILKIEKKHLEDMKVNAKKVAIENFDYNLFSDSLSNFLTQN